MLLTPLDCYAVISFILSVYLNGVFSHYRYKKCLYVQYVGFGSLIIEFLVIIRHRLRKIYISQASIPATGFNLLVLV